MPPKWQVPASKAAADLELAERKRVRPRQKNTAYRRIWLSELAFANLPTLQAHALAIELGVSLSQDSQSIEVGIFSALLPICVPKS